MFNHDQYVPILRWKGGEKRALRELFKGDRSGVTPVIEWPRLGEVETEEDRRTAPPEPQDLSRDLLDHWGARPFFCDLAQFWSGWLSEDPFQLRRYAAELASGGLRPIPVLTLSDGASYRASLTPLDSDRGLCLRLRYPDLTEAGLADRIERFCLTTGTGPATIHLLADFEIHYDAMDLPELCSRLPNVREYRTFTVAAGSFPLDLSAYQGPQLIYLQRHEWIRYQHQIGGPLPRRPTFGDYTTIHPVLSMAKAGLNPSASIRYTVDDDWLVMKGEALRKKGGPGYAQYRGQAALLMDRADYRGQEFSAGDSYVSRVATDERGFGNTTTWLQAAVNHHMTLAVRQVRTLAASAEEPRRYAQPAAARRVAEPEAAPPGQPRADRQGPLAGGT